MLQEEAQTSLKELLIKIKLPLQSHVVYTYKDTQLIKSEPGFTHTTLISCERQTGNGRGGHLSGFLIHRPGLWVCEPVNG